MVVTSLLSGPPEFAINSEKLIVNKCYAIIAFWNFKEMIRLAFGQIVQSVL